MHPRARALMAEFVERWASAIAEPRELLDVGSWNQNGTYRDLFAGWEYTGLDIHRGDGVDYVPEDPYRWTQLPARHFALVISGSCLEHMEYPWLTFEEIARVLRPGGLLCAIAPSKGVQHRVPLDCWRYYPDGMRALATWAGLDVIDVTWDRNRAWKWDDVRLVAQKPVKQVKQVRQVKQNRASRLINEEPIMCRGCKDDPEAAAKAIVADLTPQTAPALAAEFIRRELPQHVYPEGQFSGRGIVLAAGGVKYGVCAWVCVRALRHVGCTLPIEIWYRGNGERQRGLEDALSPYNVSWVDAFAVRDAGHAHARLNGWELKPFAIQWSRFAETLFIDADNVAVRDPAYLFDAPEYAEAGTVLWPDYARMAPSREAWDVFGLREYSESLAGKSERCVESGQVLLDKRRTWHCLTLANWYGERSRFFFRYVYGDKELFHLAWRRLQQPYAMPAKGIHTLQGTMCQHDFAGERVFQHRNFNKWNLTQNNRRPGFLLENECLGWIDELKAGWSPAADSFATSEDRTAIAAQDGRRYRYVREGKGHRDVELRGGTFVEGGARCERYWTIRDGRLRIAQQDGQLIMDLEPDGTGWTGRWLLHEKMPVRLERA